MFMLCSTTDKGMYLKHNKFNKETAINWDLFTLRARTSAQCNSSIQIKYAT